MTKIALRKEFEHLLDTPLRDLLDKQDAWAGIAQPDVTESSIAIPFIGEIVNWIFCNREGAYSEEASSFIPQALDEPSRIPELVEMFAAAGGNISHLEGIDIKKAIANNEPLLAGIYDGDYTYIKSDANSIVLSSRNSSIERYSSRNLLRLMAQSQTPNDIICRGSYSVDVEEFVSGMPRAWRKVNFVRIKHGKRSSMSPLELSMMGWRLGPVYGAFVNGGLTLDEFAKFVSFAADYDYDWHVTKDRRQSLVQKSIKWLRGAVPSEELAAWAYLCGAYTAGDVVGTRFLIKRFTFSGAMAVCLQVRSSEAVRYIARNPDLDIEIASALAG